MLLLWASAVLHASEMVGEVNVVASRTILVPYDPAATYANTPDRTQVHQVFEHPMNHKGLVVRYCSLAQPLPDPGNYAGIFLRA